MKTIENINDEVSVPSKNIFKMLGYVIALLYIVLQIVYHSMEYTGFDMEMVRNKFVSVGGYILEYIINVGGYILEYIIEYFSNFHTGIFSGIVLVMIYSSMAMKFFKYYNISSDELDSLITVIGIVSIITFCFEFTFFQSILIYIEILSIGFFAIKFPDYGMPLLIVVGFVLISYLFIHILDVKIVLFKHRWFAFILTVMYSLAAWDTFKCKGFLDREDGDIYLKLVIFTGFLSLFVIPMTTSILGSMIAYIVLLGVNAILIKNPEFRKTLLMVLVVLWFYEAFFNNDD